MVRLHERSVVEDDSGQPGTLKGAGKSHISRTSRDERLPYIRSARAAWEQGINEELMAIAEEKKKPFICLMYGHSISRYVNKKCNNGIL